MFAQTSLLALAALVSYAVGQVADGFENGWDKSTWPIYAPDCNQGGNITLDTTVAHTGSNSLKVVGGSNGYCGHIFFGTTDVPPGKDVYVRTWMKHTTLISDGHVTFIVMPDSGLGTGKHLRLSGQMEILEYNRESDDATLPDLSPDGIASSVDLPTGAWECLEYHLSTDGTIETWLNSKAVPGLTFTPGGSNPNANGWGTTYKPDIQGVYFGWESYGGTTDTIWYDDVAVAATRVGCSASGGSTGGGGNGGTTTAKPTTTTTTSKPKTTSTKPTTTITTKPTTTITPTTMKTSTKTTTSASSCATLYGQCGGQGWNGPTCCAAGSTCKSSGQYYSQCL